MGRQGAAGGVVRAEYRVVFGRYDGYVPQVRRWWWPVWTDLIEHVDAYALAFDAEAHARRHANPVVKKMGRLP